MKLNIRLKILAGFGVALLFLFVVGMGLRAQRRKVTTGGEGMIGKIGTVKEPLTPLGKVFVNGEWWNATCSSPSNVGDHVRVAAINGNVLTVEPVK